MSFSGLTHGCAQALRRSARAARARLRAGEERGAILVISAIMLVAIVGFAALAIDVGSYYQAQRQAQGAADAAALAGADAVAASGTAAASVTASATATANDRGATPNVTASTTAVTVSIAASTPSYFGRLFNAGSPAVGARAVASVPQISSWTTCTTADQNCWAVWASDNACPSAGSSSAPIDISAGSIALYGGVHSNGSITDGGGSNAFYGPTQYSNVAGCTVTDTGGSNAYYGGKTQVTPTAANNWPIDYSKTYPACGPSLTYHCTGPSGTPSYCRYAADSYSFSTSISASSDAATRPDIYCAYGTGDVTNPATWTGSVAFGGGGETINGSYVCGSVSVGGGSITLIPTNWSNGSGTNHMLFYAATGGIALGGGSNSFSGDMFAPTGTIDVQSGSNTTNFLEAKDVTLGSGSVAIHGDGPTVTSSGGGASSGIASLSQ